MNINFIDFRAAFNSVCDEYIWEALKHYGLPVKFTKIFQAFYTNTLKAVRVGERQTDIFFIQDQFKVAFGAGQGAVEVPLLFNIIRNWILEQGMAEKIASQGLPLHSIDYAHNALRNMLLMLITAGDLGEDELQNKQNENYQNFFLIVM